MEDWVSGTGQKLKVHDRSKCEGCFCPIHTPSDHHMRDWPLHWRGDRSIMERMCPHGIGHPDPDDFKIKTSIHDDGTHGCDGCCNENHVILTSKRLVAKMNMPKPKGPPGRLIREGDTSRQCPGCGSSRAWVYWPFIKSDKCIQPECDNYYPLEEGGLIDLINLLWWKLWT